MLLPLLTMLLLLLLLPAASCCTLYPPALHPLSTDPRGPAPRRLAQAALLALKWAVDHYSEAKSRGYDVQRALNSPTRATAGHSLQIERENDQLRATVADLGSKLQQEQEERKQQQQQQVADLQATVAAMGAQLQALVRQSSTHQG